MARRSHRVDVGIHLPIFNQKQLKSVLVYMTLCLPFTSLEDGWHSQSISHKFVPEYLQCIKAESNERHIC